MDEENLEFSKLLIDKGINLNAMYKNGKTILHEAVKDGNISFTKMLIERDADVNARDKYYGFTPLHDLLDRLEDRILDPYDYEAAVA
ncbi:hypothetical protein AVEN_252606-1 [Araneus ventricosus]|uniref:Uncharacterized protein n=1 Tax=Araneus ventricosus TaxID=182803 RepID=A0A4Y2AU40_ARAVE|nr:hypothetical protein AVEN_252606-1 [Araneus ventricosus]